MTEYTSEIKSIAAPLSAVYSKLSDLSNLKGMEDKLPEGKIKLTGIDSDSCTLSVNPVGQITLRIVERRQDDLIKFEAECSPMPFNVWIQLKEAAPDDTRLKITLRAELNMFVKPMLDKPLHEGVDRLAQLLASLDYT